MNLVCVSLILQFGVRSVVNKVKRGDPLFLLNEQHKYDCFDPNDRLLARPYFGAERDVVRLSVALESPTGKHHYLCFDIIYRTQNSFKLAFGTFSSFTVISGT
jgi:hypothetical protein